MPRPPREDVHRHFSPIPEHTQSGTNANGHSGDQHDPDADPDDADAQGKSKTFKHARVRCRHCSWCSKRDASRQAKHLSLCAEYRAWCALHGEPIVSLTAAGARRESIAASSTAGAGSPGVVPAGAGAGGEASNYFARSVDSPFGVDGGGRGLGAIGIASGPGPQQQVHGGGATYLSPPAPANPRTGAYQNRAGRGAAGQQGHGLSVLDSGPSATTGQAYHHAGYSQSHSSQSQSLDADRGTFNMQGLGEAERRRLNILYARALVAIGIRDNDFYDPTRHPQMCAFLKALNPGYEPPPKEELGALVVREFFGGMGGGDGNGRAVPSTGDDGQGQVSGNAEGDDGRGNIFG